MITDKTWKEQIRDPQAECMSEDERMVLQGEKLKNLVKRVYGVVLFIRKR